MPSKSVQIYDFSIFQFIQVISCFVKWANRSNSEHLHSLKAAIRPPRMTPERSEVSDVVPESGGRVLMAIH